MKDKSKKRKLAWWISLTTVLSLSAIGGLATAGYFIYDFVKDIFKNSKNEDPVKIVIKPIEDDYKVSSSIFESDIIQNPTYNNDENINLNLDATQWVNDELFYLTEENNRLVLNYKDPINGLLFKDYSYGVDAEGKARFLLNKSGLAYLAHEFYKKINFGPEVMLLDSINVNDFSIITDSSNGLYLPYIKTIHINGSFVSERNVSVVQKVRYLIPTLFHEYMHHWASAYVEYGLTTENSVQKTSYRLNTSSESEDNYFYKDFYNRFREILGYNSSLVNGTIKSNLISYIANKLTLSNLFDYANTTDNSLYTIIQAKVNSIEDENNEIYFRANDNFNKTKDGTRITIDDYDADNLPYYYSLTELIPREWLKYNYVPYYLNERSLNNLNNNKNSVSQNYFGTWALSQYTGSYVFSPNAYNLDWTRTMRYGWADYDARNLKEDSQWIYPNNVFKQPISKNNYPEYYKKFYNVNDYEYKYDAYLEFYYLFLETMGFNKPISLMQNTIQWSYGKIDNLIINRNKEATYKLLGYLDDKRYNKIVFIKDGKYDPNAIVSINFMNYYNFNAKNAFDNDQWMISPSDINESYGAKLLESNAKAYAYYSDEFSYKKDLNDFQIAFWADLNNDNKISEDELKINFSTAPTPSRYVLNSELNRSGKNYSPFTIYSTQNNNQYSIKIKDGVYDWKEDHISTDRVDN